MYHLRLAFIALSLTAGLTACGGDSPQALAKRLDSALKAGDMDAAIGLIEWHQPRGDEPQHAVRAHRWPFPPRLPAAIPIDVTPRRLHRFLYPDRRIRAVQIANSSMLPSRC